MSEHTAQAIAGLERTLRDAATQALQPDLSLTLALGFFRAVISLVRILRQYRAYAGLPTELSLEMLLLLSSVKDCANQRFCDRTLSSAQRLRALSAYVGLTRTIVAAFPRPEKRQKPQPIAARKPEQAVAPPRRKTDYENIGAIAIRAQDAALPRNPLLEEALRQIASAAAPIPASIPRSSPSPATMRQS